MEFADKAVFRPRRRARGLHPILRALADAFSGVKVGFRHASTQLRAAGWLLAEVPGARAGRGFEADYGCAAQGRRQGQGEKKA